MKLGIVAGSGDLPLALIARCQSQNIDFHVFPFSAVNYMQFPHDVIRPGGGGTFLNLIKQHSITDVLFIGAIQRPSPWQFWPDWLTISLLPRLLKVWRGDDGLLSTVVNILEEKSGVRVRGVHEFMPELLADKGVWGSHQPTDDMQQAIAIGTAAALALGQADIGQAVIADTNGVQAREDRRGTASMLKNFKSATASSVLVKLCKPQQELRIDLPTIGSRTIASAKQAGLSGIAVSAGKTLIVDKAATIAAADAAGLFLIGVEA